MRRSVCCSALRCAVFRHRFAQNEYLLLHCALLCSAPVLCSPSAHIKRNATRCTVRRPVIIIFHDFLQIERAEEVMMSSPPSDSPSEAPRLYSTLLASPLPSATRATRHGRARVLSSADGHSFCTLLYCTVLREQYSAAFYNHPSVSHRIASYASSLIASLLCGSLHLIESLSAVIHLQTRPDAPPAFCLLLCSSTASPVQ